MSFPYLDTLDVPKMVLEFCYGWGARDPLLAAGLTVHQCNIQLLAIEMFKAAKKLCPTIVQDLFTFDQNENRDKTFSRPNVNNKNTGENTIRYFGPIV